MGAFSWHVVRAQTRSSSPWMTAKMGTNFTLDDSPPKARAAKPTVVKPAAQRAGKQHPNHEDSRRDAERRGPLAQLNPNSRPIPTAASHRGKQHHQPLQPGSASVRTPGDEYRLNDAPLKLAPESEVEASELVDEAGESFDLNAR